MPEALDITCPCCEALLKVDPETGSVVWADRKKAKPKDFDDLVTRAQSQKSVLDAKFARSVKQTKHAAEIRSRRVTTTRGGAASSATLVATKDTAHSTHAVTSAARAPIGIGVGSAKEEIGDGDRAQDSGEVGGEAASDRVARLSDADLWIASIVRSRRAVLVTGNEKHFKRIPNVPVENWLRKD